MISFDLFDRAARPLTRHMGWVFIVLVIFFLIAAGALFLKALNNWAEGRLAIDWGGIAALLVAMGTAAGSIITIVSQLNAQRSNERIASIQAGAAPPPLAVPPSPHSGGGGGGLVNENAL